MLKTAFYIVDSYFIATKGKKNVLIFSQKNSDNEFQIYSDTTQKMTFFITDFSSKCDQIRIKLRIWSHLLEKSLMENIIFCAA